MWHLRVGDTVLRVEPEVVARVQRIVDAGFPLRGTRHVAVADKHRLADVRKYFPTLEADLGFELRAAGLDEEAAFALLRGAEVLVSTGSSFAIAASAVSPTGSQVHFFFPPKEADIMYVCAPIDPITLPCTDKNPEPKGQTEPRANDAWRTYFMARSTVPLTLGGEVFSGYGLKARSLMRRIDDGGAGSDNTWLLGGLTSGWDAAALEDRTPHIHSELYL